jgi:putative membrane protein insertion efficiency factor
MSAAWRQRLLELPCRGLIGLVRGYRFFLKPWLGNACRFEPTCSAYALEALQRHGALRGTALAGWRVLRCQPWCDGGCDPVPHNAPRLAAGLFTRLTSNPAAPPETPGEPSRKLP